MQLQMTSNSAHRTRPQTSQAEDSETEFANSSKALVTCDDSANNFADSKEFTDCLEEKSNSNPDLGFPQRSLPPDDFTFVSEAYFENKIGNDNEDEGHLTADSTTHFNKKARKRSMRTKSFICVSFILFLVTLAIVNSIYFMGGSHSSTSSSWYTKFRNDFVEKFTQHLHSTKSDNIYFSDSESYSYDTEDGEIVNISK